MKSKITKATREELIDRLSAMLTRTEAVKSEKGRDYAYGTLQAHIELFIEELEDGRS